MREYFVAYKEKKFDDILQLNRGNYKVIRNNIGCWAADPFIVEKDGELYIFAEIWEHIKCKGSIGYSKYDKNNERFGKWKIIIDEPYHLSYPCIYKVKDKFWMCPESGDAQEIALYCADNFPDEWSKKIVLSSKGKYVDTTFFSVENKNYGMTLEIQGQQEDLKIFKFKKSTIQFLNNEKIIKDTRIERPGGKIVYQNNHLYRIGQIGAPHYGSGLIVAEFSFMNDVYYESILKRFYPADFEIDGLNKKQITGVHTYNQSNRYEVIDVQIEKKSIFSFLFLLIRKYRRWIDNASITNKC